MSDSIPVPAEALRQVASSATEEVSAARERGHKSTARMTERDLSEAYRALDGNDGEYVSVSASAVARLTAAADYSEVADYCNCCRHYLEQYNYW